MAQNAILVSFWSLSNNLFFGIIFGFDFWINHLKNTFLVDIHTFLFISNSAPVSVLELLSHLRIWVLKIAYELLIAIKIRRPGNSVLYSIVRKLCKKFIYSVILAKWWILMEILKKCQDIEKNYGESLGNLLKSVS